MSDPLIRTDSAQRSPRLRSLAGRVYPFRTLGMGVGIVPVLLVLHELAAPWPAWCWTLFCGTVWPHLAYHLHARRSADPSNAELRNLMVDSAMAGSLASLMHFTLLPSVVLLTVVTADKINSGVRGLWRYSLVAMMAGLVVTGLMTGFAVRLDTSTPVLLACLPIMVVHTLAVSLSTYRLIRRVQKQNERLDALSRFDALTGLESRRHWQEQASALLQQHIVRQMDASLILIDVDHFKSINDRYGHATGDDVLRGIADVIQHTTPVGSHPGRLGGDEFAVVLSMPLLQATVVAHDIRAGVAALTFPEWPALHCTVSIGLASPASADDDLRQWTTIADKALYQAKALGRNTVVGAPHDAPSAKQPSTQPSDHGNDGCRPIKDVS